MIALLKQAPFDILVTLFPNSLNDIERLVNNSLVVLRKPEKNFPPVLNLLTEIDYLLSVTPVDQMISLQVYDVKTQWTFLTELVIELAKQAETASVSFIKQFNWVIQTFIKPGFPFTDSNRDSILLLLIPKALELDQTSDLLGIVTKTYTDISFQFSDEQIGGYAHLILLTDEKKRQEYLKQFRYDLPPQVIQIARMALRRHDEFLQRDQNREAKYE
jgi:hypothetical protein